MSGKKWVLAAGLLMTTFATHAQEEDDWKEDIFYSIGIKAGYMSMDLDTEGYSDSSEYTIPVGASAGVRKGKWYLGFNAVSAKYSLPNLDVAGEDLDLERRELDLFVGYFFHPRIAVLGGYKETTFDIPGEKVFYFSGQALGVTGFYPIENTSQLFYGTYTQVQVSNESADVDSGGPSMEFGISGPIEDTSLTYSAGLRYQKYKYTASDFTETDTYTGMMFGMNYTF